MNTNKGKQQLKDKVNSLKENHNNFIKTFPKEYQEMFSDIKEYEMQAFRIKAKHSSDEYYIISDEYRTNKYLMAKAKKLKVKITIKFLSRFCRTIECAEEAFSKFANKNILIGMVTSVLDFNKNFLVDVNSTLAFPNNDIWKYCIPLKGNVKYTDHNGIETIYDLGIVYTCGEWCSAVADGNNGGDYLSSSDWLNRECYKDTFLKAFDVGIFDNEDKFSLLHKYGIVDNIFNMSLKETRSLFKEDYKF